MKDQPMYREIKIKTINPIYAIGLTWLLYGLILPLYRFTDLAIVAGLSGIAYILARKFLPERTVLQPLTFDGGLDTRCMEIIDQGYAYIGELSRFEISDKTLAGHVREIISTSRQMLDYTAKNPRVALDLRSFIDYYFPVTIKFLKAYTTMDEQEVKGENVEGIMNKVDSIMGTIVPAFRKQLDSMYTHKRLDIKTDIEVLKSVLAAEGLTDEKEDSR